MREQADRQATRSAEIAEQRVAFDRDADLYDQILRDYVTEDSRDAAWKWLLSAWPVTGAAALAPTIVLTVPAGAVSDVLAALGSVEGKVLVDCTNAIGKGFQLEVGHTSSSSEELARRAPGANVVRSFNQQGVEVLDNPLFGATAATNFVAGDDAASRTRVLELARDLGLDAVDAGPLASSRLLEPLTLLWIAMARALGTREIGLTLRRRQRS